MLGQQWERAAQSVVRWFRIRSLPIRESERYLQLHERLQTDLQYLTIFQQITAIPPVEDASFNVFTYLHPDLGAVSYFGQRINIDHIGRQWSLTVLQPQDVLTEATFEAMSAYDGTDLWVNESENVWR